MAVKRIFTKGGLKLAHSSRQRRRCSSQSRIGKKAEHLAQAIPISPLDRLWQEEKLLLNLGCATQQTHDLRNAGTGGHVTFSAGG
jgi:hypothetical protein